MIILAIAHGISFLFAFEIGIMSYNRCKKLGFPDNIYREFIDWDGKIYKVKQEPLSCSQWLQLKPNKRHEIFGRGR